MWTELAKFYDLHMIVFDTQSHAFAKHRDVKNAYQHVTISSSVRRAALLNRLSDPKVKGKALIIDAINSYPMGGGVGQLAHPDLLMLRQLDGDLIDLRVIILYRSPTDAVMSAVRRFSEENPYKTFSWQARSSQMSMSLINNAVPHLACGKTMLIKYEALIANPSLYVHKLSKLLNVAESVLALCVKHIGLSESRGMKEETPAQLSKRHALDEFFTAQQYQWPFLTGAASLPPVRNASSLFNITIVTRASAEPVAIDGV